MPQRRQPAPTMNRAMTHFFGGGYAGLVPRRDRADSGNGLSNGVMFVNNR